MDKKWTKDQKNAISSTNGTVLVSAAAGSGKTAVLVQRIIEQITREIDPVNIDEFLIVTFTKAAAQEMKTRISNKLSEMIIKNPENTNLYRQQLKLNCASIGTIHSFCNNIVKENFYKLGISPKFRIADDSEIVILKDVAMENTLNYFYELKNQKFEAVLHIFSSDKDDNCLIEVINQIYDFTRSLPFPRTWMKTQLSNYKTFKGDIKNSPWGKVLLQNAEQSLKSIIEIIKEILEMANKNETIKKAYSEALENDLEKLENILTDFETSTWDELCSKIDSFAFSKFKPLKSQEVEFEKEYINLKRDATKETFKNLQKYFAFTSSETKESIQLLGGIIETLFEITIYFKKELDNLKLLRNIADFSDLEHWAVKLLTEITDDAVKPSKLAKEISEKYREVMVDEYQDINEIQDMIFKMITKNETNLFAVGDVKQSIYKFRRSSPKIFLEKKARYNLYSPEKENHPAKIMLSKNFRSDKGIIDGINFIFENLMSEKVGEINYNEEEILVSGAMYPEIKEPSVSVKILDVSGTEDDSDILEARNIAKTITKMVCEGYSIYEDGEERPVTYSDFCILLRSSNAHAHIYAKELYKCGVPVWSETNGKFLETSEISTIISLLKVIDNPVQDIPLISTLISPIFNFTIDELTKIRKIDETAPFYFALKEYADNGCEKSKSFLDKMDKYRRMCMVLACHEFIDHIYYETDYPAMCLAMEKGEIKKANLMLFLEYAERFENQYHSGLSGFLNYIDSIKKKNSDLQPASISSESENTVKIMSIHKSKGLEFPVCIIAGCGKKFNFDTNRLIIHPDLGLGFKLKNQDNTARYDNLIRRTISCVNRSEDLSEEMRILYVALTRAKQKLIIVASLKDAQKVVQKSLFMCENKKTLSPQIVESASSFAHWIIFCIVNSNLKSKFCSVCDVICNSLDKSEHNLNWEIEFIKEDVDVNEFEAEDIIFKEDVIFDDQLSDKIIKRFDFNYKNKNAVNLPVRISASKFDKSSQWEKYIASSKPSFMIARSFTAADKGTILHKFMCYCDFKNVWQNGVKHEIDSLINRGFITKTEAKVIDRLAIEKFIQSDLAKRIMKSPKVLREHRFSVNIPGDFFTSEFTENQELIVMQGAIDCAFLENEGYVIVDYKTDKTSSAKELYEKYENQLKLYKFALESTTGKPVNELIIYSFYSGEIISNNALD